MSEEDIASDGEEIVPDIAEPLHFFLVMVAKHKNKNLKIRSYTFGWQNYSRCCGINKENNFFIQIIASSYKLLLPSLYNNYEDD